MKIGYDGKRAVLNNTGLGNYSRLAAEVLATRYPENEYLLYTPVMRDNPRLKSLRELANVVFRTPDTAAGRAMGSVWRVCGMTGQMKREGVDLVHGLSGELPLNIAASGIPSVVTVHDLIFRRHPECYSPIDRKIYDYKFRCSAKGATRVLAISQCTKADLMEFYGISDDKIDVVYQGCASQFHRIPAEAEIAAVRGKYGIGRPYIISVGTIEARKNQLQAVEGLRGLPADIMLVLVGRRTAYASDIDRCIAANHLEQRVRFIEHADFADLPALYAGAICSTYTSRYEGFGIPVIESLCTGTPAIVAIGSCLEEAGGPDAPAVNPDDNDAWISTARMLIDDRQEHDRIAAAGHEYVKRFGDDAMAAGIMAVYRKALAAYGK